VLSVAWVEAGFGGLPPLRREKGARTGHGRFESAAEFALLSGKKFFCKILILNGLIKLALQNLDSKSVTLKILQSKDLRGGYLR
jgi:hypothetical protein